MNGILAESDFSRSKECVFKDKNGIVLEGLRFDFLFEVIDGDSVVRRFVQDDHLLFDALFQVFHEEFNRRRETILAAGFVVAHHENHEFRLALE